MGRTLVVLMGFALPGDNMHGPNERFYLPNFFKGIDTSIWFLHLIGSQPRSWAGLEASPRSVEATQLVRL